MDYKGIINDKYVQKFGQYLRNLLNFLAAYEVVDKISKARDLPDFSDGVRAATRLSIPLQRKAKSEKILLDVNVLTEEDIQNLYNIAENVYKENPKSFKFLLNLIASLAFSHKGD
ncbi:MAG: hypothetical protein QXF82_10015 [Nitrososphaeria archaeon]